MRDRAAKKKADHTWSKENSAKHEPTICVGSCWDGATSTEMVIIKDSKNNVNFQLS
jgi:hypothetical protein